jgi:hypothetical protein
MDSQIKKTSLTSEQQQTNNNNKSTFSIDNIIYGANENLVDDHSQVKTTSAESTNGKKSKSSSSSTCSSSSTANSKKMQLQTTRVKTPPGLENLPIPPPVTNTTTTSPYSKQQSLSSNLTSPTANASLESWFSLFNPAAAAAAAMAFNPMFLNAPSQVSSSQMAQLLTTQSERNQLLNRYQPYMSQLAMVANLSNLNQSNTSNSSPPNNPASTNAQNLKYFNKT